MAEKNSEANFEWSGQAQRIANVRTVGVNRSSASDCVDALHPKDEQQSLIFRRGHLFAVIRLCVAINWRLP
jgi:hypothetical protein